MIIFKALILSVIIQQCMASRDYIPFDMSYLSESSFFEQFDNLSRWNITPTTYQRWSLEKPIVLPGFENDMGLVLQGIDTRSIIYTNNAEISLDISEAPIVVQYEFKAQTELTACTGAFLTLYHDEEPLLQFGPDKCGGGGKVKLALNRPTGFKDVVNVPPAKLDYATHLYTLVLSNDNTYEIRVDGVLVVTGNLLEQGATEPPLNPPLLIDDPTDLPPEDWDDKPEIPDPSITKPFNWDSREYIPDPKDRKPDDWLDGVERLIPDPSKKQPDNWDTKRGRWVAPYIVNPLCKDRGCGVWKPRKINNPKYSGEWKQPMISNAKYRGLWKARQIPNPDYVEDKHPTNLSVVNKVGFDIYSAHNDLLFDNIYVGHYIDEAEFIGNATFVPKSSVELGQLHAKKAAPPPFVAEDDDIIDKLWRSVSEHWIVAMATVICGVAVLVGHGM